MSSRRRVRCTLSSLAASTTPRGKERLLATRELAQPQGVGKQPSADRRLFGASIVIRL